MRLEPRTLGYVGVGAKILTLRAIPTRARYIQSALQAVALASGATGIRQANAYVTAALRGTSIDASVPQRYFTRALELAGTRLTGAKGVLIAQGALRQVGLAGVGVGALNITDPTLGDTASALAQSLDTAGCQPTFQQNVADFQSAYNNAGGSPTLKVDGLYGDKTAGALQTAVNGPVVAGCVGQAVSGGGGGGAVVPSTAPVVSQSVGGTDLLPLALAGIAGAGLIGWAIYAKKRGRTRIIRRLAHHRR